MSDQMIFKRYELKYMLTRAQRDALLTAMDGHLQLDQYGHKTVRNIYFDTDTYQLIRRSIEKPVYKEKLRLRAYEQAAGEDTVFVELKKKYEAVVYKRRLILPKDAAMEALVSGEPLPVKGQIASEINYFRDYYRTLRPAVFLTYEREAFEPTDGVDFRLTLDENILYRTEDIDLGAEIYGEALLNEDQVLMELKTPGGIPMWMIKFLSENQIRRASYSKYGAAYTRMFEAKYKGGLLYA